jgi:hypothetical protein
MKRNRWPLYLGIFAIVLLVAAAVIRYLTPPIVNIPETKTLKTNLDGTQTTFQSVKYTGPAFSGPSELPIQRLTQTIPMTSVRDELVADFNLKNSGAGSWSSDTYSLSFINQINQYIFVSNTFLEPTQQVINRDQAQIVAQSFIQKYFSQLNLDLVANKIQAMSDQDGSDTTSTNEANATMYQFPFSYTFEGIPLAYGSISSLPVKVVVNINYQPQKVSFFSSLYKFVTLSNKPLISVESAVANINQGKASITSAFQPDFQQIDLSTISSAELTSVELEYKLDNESKLAYPFYHFKGAAKTPQDTLLEVEIVTPAVETNK